MILISEETHRDLYYDVEKCIKYCKQISEKDQNEIVDYHMLWLVTNLPFSRKQALPVKSYLTTQNLKTTRLNVWSNVDLSENEYLKPLIEKFPDNIKIRKWDPVEEAKGTPLEGKNYLTLNDSRCYISGDLFRILCLHNHGGLYVDVDVVFLRDFSPLLDQEFMYKWSFQENMINGAVMRLFKKSLLSQQLLETMVELGALPDSLNWSSTLYEKVYEKNKNWTIFPSGFFNTEWQIKLSDQEKSDPKNRDLLNFIRYPFKKNPLSHEMYDGAFCWHWHNGWTTEIENGSKWELLESKANFKLVQAHGDKIVYQDIYLQY